MATLLNHCPVIQNEEIESDDGHSDRDEGFDDPEGLGNGGSVTHRPSSAGLGAQRIDSYRFSQANLEDSQDVDLDAILGELSALGNQMDEEIEKSQKCRSRLRTDSPDNDSAFSDNVSMLSSESSASSGASGHRTNVSKSSGISVSSASSSSGKCDQSAAIKAEKIRLALEKMRSATIKRLFIKTFSADGSTKSLLVDENMRCGYVTRLLSEKNHVKMDLRWSLVEHLPDLMMERVYEDHELLVDNLMLWNRDSKNMLLFVARPDKYDLFLRPEYYLSPLHTGGPLEDEVRAALIEECFGGAGIRIPELEGMLYLKADAKKAWKRCHFVLRASGLYFCHKGRSRLSKDLVCLTTFESTQVYYGVGCRKKFKAPTDYCFSLKQPQIQTKSGKCIKYLCTEDEKTLWRWVAGIRIAKHGRQLLENYRTLTDDLAQEDIDQLVSIRSFSVASVSSSSIGTLVSNEEVPRSSSSSSSSSAAAAAIATSCSEQENLLSSSGSSVCEHTGGGATGFESDFPTGTIKRKPSLTARLPLTPTTRMIVQELEDHIEGHLNESGTLCRTSLRQGLRRSLTEEINSLRSRKGAAAAAAARREEDPATPGFPPLPPEDDLPPPPPEVYASSCSLDSLDTNPDLHVPLPSPPPELLTEDARPLPRAPGFEGVCAGVEGITVAPAPAFGGFATTPCPPPPLRATEDPSVAAAAAFTLPPPPPPPPSSTSTSLRRLSAHGVQEPRRLGSPHSSVAPPRQFLNDLQRVMQKKWQVAQKLKAEELSYPQEVLGFRDVAAVAEAPPPAAGDKGTTSSSNVHQWLEQHYGRSASLKATSLSRMDSCRSSTKKLPPPPPPRRNDSTQLSKPRPC